MLGDNQIRDLELLARVRAGDCDAMEQLVEKYTPLVRYIVRNYYAKFFEFEDLMQEGMIGLINAVNEYDHTRYNIKFSSFAYICIIRKIYNVIKRINGNKHRALNDAVSLFSYINLDETRMVMDIIENDDQKSNPEEVIETRFIDERIDQLLRDHLSVLEYTVIRKLLEGYSYHEIQEEYGIAPKVIDNARTRVRLKLQRIVNKYGSLLSPQVPKKTRRREDLYYNFDLPEMRRVGTTDY
ncbi:MAG: sigma-70 family RNA polymerase sigma factor [Firmicutes bacterium]|nr:sigma-70 family RNA polymerase sigma factor [Bacillota bacterium]